MTSRFDRDVRRTASPLPLARLRADGVRAKSLRGTSWRRTTYGHYAPVRLGDSSGPSQRIIELAPMVPPTGAFAGWAAAWIHGVECADGLHPHTLVPLPVTIALGSATGRGQHAGATFSRERLPAGDVTTRAGLRVTTASRTAFDLMRWSTDLTEAVVAADAVLQANVVDRATLRAYVDDHRGWKGVPLAREALDLAAVGVRSPWESRLRVCCETEAGLPKLLINQPVFARNGGLVAVVDLLDEEAAMVIEFDGQHHRDRTQHAADNVREESLESLGLTVVRTDSITWRTDRRGLVHRLRDGRARGLRRDRRYDRWSLHP